ncbi:MAG: PDZ domain-containing protein [Deltaproteobacteria bacterium]|nr:PDZ domain-containing protein [Deltaproteobacteria bacterium]
MRLVAGLLALTLTGTFAFAEDAKAPEPQPTQPEPTRAKVGLRVVKVMTESHQALLFDKNRGKHVVADVGSVIGGYTVMEIEEDEVTLSSGGREVVLAAPEPTWRRPADTQAVAVAVAPADPYAGPAIEAPAVAGEDGVRVAAAPSSEPVTNPYDEATLDAAMTPGAGEVRLVRTREAVTTTEMEVNPYNEPEPALPESATDPYAEPAPAPAPVAKPTKPVKKGTVDDEGARAFADAMNGHVIVKGPDDATIAPTASAPPAASAQPATMLSRTELESALSDFGVLTASVRGAFTPAGARLDAVAPGSVFAKAGLRSGDVITAVDGAPLTSIDDAADLYIRAGSVKTANVQLLRAGKPMTLRLAIQ